MRRDTNWSMEYQAKGPNDFFNYLLHASQPAPMLAPVTPVEWATPTGRPRRP